LKVDLDRRLVSGVGWLRHPTPGKTGKLQAQATTVPLPPSPPNRRRRRQRRFFIAVDHLLLTVAHDLGVWENR
jgi:hypothetical protein